MLKRYAGLRVLAETVVVQLADRGLYSPLVLDFPEVMCPCCASERMSALSLGEKKMKCPDCSAYAGINANPDSISSTNTWRI